MCATMMAKAEDMRHLCLETASTFQHVVGQGRANEEGEIIQTTVAQTDGNVIDALVLAAVTEGTQKDRHLPPQADENSVLKHPLPPPQPGMRVRAISRVQGAPSGKTAMLIPPGNDFYIQDVICEEGVWYASSTLYSRLWFPLASFEPDGQEPIGT